MLPLPELTAENTAFWTGGERGELMIAFCEDCAHAVHPPQLLCPRCHSQRVSPRAVAGTGTVYTFTVNHQPWIPGMDVPFILAVVDVDAPWSWTSRQPTRWPPSTSGSTLPTTRSVGAPARELAPACLLYTSPSPRD